jgi:hypothetical protein
VDPEPPVGVGDDGDTEGESMNDKDVCDLKEERNSAVDIQEDAELSEKDILYCTVQLHYNGCLRQPVELASPSCLE